MEKYLIFTYKVEAETKLTQEIIINSINTFWKEHMSSFKSNKQVGLIYRVVFYKDNKRVTLIERKSFVYGDLDLFRGLVLNLFEYSDNETIKNNIVNKIIIKFKTLDNVKVDNKTVSYFKLVDYRIPMTMDLKSWGVFYDNIDENTSIIKKRSTNSIYKITKIDSLTNLIELKNNFETLITFKDIRREGDPLNTFTRVYEGNVYFIYNGNRNFRLYKRNKNI